MKNRVFVACESGHQFLDWCRWRKLNPNSRDICPLAFNNPHTMRGFRFYDGDGLIWIEGMRIWGPDDNERYWDAHNYVMMMLKWAEIDGIHVGQATHHIRPEDDYDLELPGFVPQVMENDPWATKTRKEKTRITICPHPIPKFELP